LLSLNYFLIFVFKEPPPARLEKPLPAPDEVAKKRRGGRRVRKMKKRILANEVDKAMNRLKFGEIQDDLLQTKIGYDVGMLGRGGTGRVPLLFLYNLIFFYFF
jgi:U4/U6 small nuclear ribonucleoprotein PRP31